MKTNYFTKVENKYVFNFSLIFWHLFIILSTVIIIFSILLFLWTLIPPSEKKVVKQQYPEKQSYPDPIKVTLDELITTKNIQAEISKVKNQKQTNVKTEKQETNLDTLGIKEYNTSFEILKNLIPPSKYSWLGSGYWYYPYGKRYWDVYKNKEYRKWINIEASVEEKLNYSYEKSNAKTFSEKKQLLDSYIKVIKPLPEKNRLEALNYLMKNIAKNISQNINVFNSISKVVPKMTNEDNISYLKQLAYFGKKNPNDGALFIDYISKIIDKFNMQQRAKTINYLINGYYDYFSQDLAKQKEATNLFIPMLGKMNEKYEPNILLKYYKLYLNKNYERNNLIAKIDKEYNKKIDEIEEQYRKEQTLASMELEGKKVLKSELRYKSLAGIGGGILLIVLIAMLLVFFSIQRSVRKIEENLSTQNNN